MLPRIGSRRRRWLLPPSMRAFLERVVFRRAKQLTIDEMDAEQRMDEIDKILFFFLGSRGCCWTILI